MFNYKKLADLMHSRSVPQNELAEAIGVTPAAVSYIVRGLNDPSLKVAKRIAKYFGVTVDELTTDENQ